MKGQNPNTATIQSPLTEYELFERLPDGEVYEIHKARLRTESGSKTVLVKIALGVDVNDLAENEARILEHLNQETAEMALGNRLMIPEILEQFEYHGKRVVVTDFAEGYFTLEQIHEEYPNGIPAEHAWIFNRMLEAMMLTHPCGVIHGSILPPHVLIYSGSETDPLRHKGCLIDWTNAVKEKSFNVWPKLSSMSSMEEYAVFYPREVDLREPVTPQTDLAMFAGCAIYLLGGDVKTETVPDSTPWNIAQLLRTCRHQNSAERPRNISEFYHQFKLALFACFGEPKFRELPIPAIRK